MQTFLPYPDFECSAHVLDYKRLGKQRLEAWGILETLAGVKSGWKHHPAVAMWRGYESALENYYAAICREWVRRGYRNTMPIIIPHPDPVLPPWLGDPAFHASHRSNLLRKWPDYYNQFGWTEGPDMPYIWP
jgi:hypothetical protein